MLSRSALRRAASLSIRRFERDALQRVRITTTTSHADRDALLDVLPSAPIEVVPNGVDTSYFAPQKEPDHADALIAFHGNLAYSPNADAARFLAQDVFPRVLTHVPQERLRLIGRNPPADVRALAGPDVDVTGEVEDVRPLLAEATIVACAVRTGTGIKNKLLEAAALALPIVATTGAVGDLNFATTRSCWCATTLTRSHVRSSNCSAIPTGASGSAERPGRPSSSAGPGSARPPGSSRSMRRSGEHDVRGRLRLHGESRAKSVAEAVAPRAGSCPRGCQL